MASASAPSLSDHGIVTLEEILQRNKQLASGLAEADSRSGSLVANAQAEVDLASQLREENAHLRAQLDAITLKYWEARDALGDTDRQALARSAQEAKASYDELHEKHKKLNEVFRKSTEHLEGLLAEEKKNVMRNEVKHRLQAKSLRELTEKYLDEVNARKDLEARVADVEARCAAQVAELQKEVRRLRSHANDLNLMYLQTKMVKEESQVALREVQQKVAKREAAAAAAVVGKLHRSASRGSTTMRASSSRASLSTTARV